MLAVGGCTGAPMATGAANDAIIGGVTDASDPGVVLLYFTTPGQSGGELCTGEVISPHVVLTAAHCAGGDDASVTSTYHVYLGDDFGAATTADLLPVAAAHFNPAFDPGDLAAGNDIGVYLMQGALPASATPLVYNRASIDAGFDGAAVRFVGYGLDNATTQTGGGIKRATSTTLTDHTALLLHFSDGTHETCNGDSGGPAFMNVDGRQVIVGLTSYGDVACAAGGYDTRVDAQAAWIDGWVAQADPGFISSTPPTPSGGTQSPPTSSATPMPPSSTGAGGVGASCVSCDGDGPEVHGGCALAVDDTTSGGGAALFLIGVMAAAARRRRRA
jgi:MYXO-CTERM domain-containing protein